MLAKIFKITVVNSVAFTFHFIKRHPLITFLILLFFLVLPFIYETYTTARSIYVALLKTIDYFSGKDENGDDVGFWAKLWRKLLLLALWVFIPGSSFIFFLACVSGWIGRSRALDKSQSAQPANLTAIKPN